MQAFAQRWLADLRPVDAFQVRIFSQASFLRIDDFAVRYPRAGFALRLHLGIILITSLNLVWRISCGP